MTQTEVPYFWHCVASSFMEDPFSTLSTQMILLKHRAYSLCHLWSKSMIVLMFHCSCSYFAKLCCNMKSWNISSVEKDFFSHTLALCWWFFKVVICEKALLHLSHLYGFSPVWDRLCLCKNSFFILLNLSLFRKFHSPANTKLWRILCHNLGTSVFSRYCAAFCAGWQSLGCWTLAHSPRTKIKFVD